jgi:hypothetical protein
MGNDDELLDTTLLGHSQMMLDRLMRSKLRRRPFVGKIVDAGDRSLLDLLYPEIIK